MGGFTLMIHIHATFTLSINQLANPSSCGLEVGDRAK
jgi:hypothetical protein